MNITDEYARLCALRGAATPGPFSTGRTLITRTTGQWTTEQIEHNDRVENRMVFANFKPQDEGRSRVMVGTCNDREDAAFIAAAHDMMALIDKLMAERVALRKALAPMPQGTALITGEQVDAARAILAKTEGGK